MPKGKKLIKANASRKLPWHPVIERIKLRKRELLTQQAMQESWKHKHTYTFHRMLRLLPPKMQSSAHELLKLQKTTKAIEKLNSQKKQFKAERQTDNIIKFVAVNHPERGIRFIATAALGEFTQPFPISLLKKIALTDKDWGVKHQAVFSLKKFGYHSRLAIKELILWHPETSSHVENHLITSIHVEAIKALGEIGSKTNAVFLEERSKKDKSREVRAEAEHARKKLLQKPPRNI